MFSPNTVKYGPLIRGRHLLDGGTYFQLSVNGKALIRGKDLFTARRLLKEIR